MSVVYDPPSPVASTMLDADALARLYEEYAGWLTVVLAPRFRPALHRHGSVEDLVQEAFARIWEQREKLVRPENGGAGKYLWRIAQNVLKESIQRRNREIVRGRITGRASEGPDWEGQVPAAITRASQAAMRSESVTRALRVLEEMGAEDAEILVWARYGSFDCVKIAERLDVSHAAARKRLSRAQRRMCQVRDELNRRLGEVALPRELEHGAGA